MADYNSGNDHYDPRRPHGGGYRDREDHQRYQYDPESYSEGRENSQRYPTDRRYSPPRRERREHYNPPYQDSPTRDPHQSKNTDMYNRDQQDQYQENSPPQGDPHGRYRQNSPQRGNPGDRYHQDSTPRGEPHERYDPRQRSKSRDKYDDRSYSPDMLESDRFRHTEDERPRIQEDGEPRKPDIPSHVKNGTAEVYSHSNDDPNIHAKELDKKGQYRLDGAEGFINKAYEPIDDEYGREVNQAGHPDGLRHRGHASSTAKREQLDQEDDDVLQGDQDGLRRRVRLNRLDDRLQAEREEEELPPIDYREARIRLLATRKDLLEKDRKRDELQVAKTKKLTGFRKWKYDWSIRFAKWKRGMHDALLNLELWRSSFKVIEGNFGASIVSYFRFIKLLFFLNFFITAVQLLVIVMPQEVFDPKTFNGTFKNLTALNHLQQEAVTCTVTYEEFMRNITSSQLPQRVQDFFQGTGWMEDKILFYGYYFNKKSLNHGEIRLYYNMPMAFFFGIFFCFFVSLILLVHRSAYGMKHSLTASGQRFNQSFTTVFCGWDYNLCEDQAAELKHKNLLQEYQSSLNEQKLEEAKKKMTTGQKICMYLTRLLINIFVLAVLGASFFLIYYVTEESAKLVSDTPSGRPEILLYQYLPSLTITVLNIIVPFIFQKIVTAEKYSPEYEIYFTIVRTVFLRLASLLFLMFSMRNVILNCKEKKCGVCNDVGFKCWESYVGQQIYKLVILNFIVTVVITILVEFPRKIIVSKFENVKLVEMVGLQEFDLSKNVLDIIYTQTLCWLGAFYSPLIPGMALVTLFIFFYVKKASLLVNCTPPARAHRSSQSNSFFMLVLLLSLVIVCIIPVGYSIGNISPSQGCGPFRVYSRPDFYMYTVIKDLVHSWPLPVPDIYFTIGSWAVFIPLIVILILMIVYYAAKISSSKKLAELLEDQLALEGKDKQFLLKRVNEALMSGTK